jgi:hypothetical protein
MPRPGRFNPRERPGTHSTGGRLGPGQVCTGAENLASTGIRSPDSPAHSEDYAIPGHKKNQYVRFVIITIIIIIYCNHHHYLGPRVA